MSDQIQRLACSLSESSNDLAIKQAEYNAALVIHEGIKDKLTTALYERKNPDSTAIALDDDEVLLCLWQGIEHYEFSLIRFYS